MALRGHITLRAQISSSPSHTQSANQLVGLGDGTYAARADAEASDELHDRRRARGGERRCAHCDQEGGARREPLDDKRDERAAAMEWGRR